MSNSKLPLWGGSVNSEPQDDRESLSLGVIQKPNGEQIRLEWTRYHGRPFLDVRIWYQAEDGTWHPSKRGVSVGKHQIRDFVRACGLALDEAGIGGGR